MSNMESDMIIINVVAKKSSKTIELSVPDDVFNQAERIFLKNERGVFYKIFPAEAFGSDAWRNTKDGNPEVDPKSGWSDDVLVVDKDPDGCRYKTVASYYKEQDFWTDSDGNILFNVTHWQPWPDFPQEDNDD